MQSKTKNVLIAVLIVGLVSMTVAYAAFSTQLTISSSAKVAATKWEVKITDWTQVTVSNLNGGTSDATVKASPSVTDASVTGIEVTFKKPGDAARFTFNIQNHGDIDAKLNTATGMSETVSGVTKTVKCANATPTAGGAAFELSKKTGTTPGSISCVMDISYNKDATTMPDDEQTVSLTDVVFVYGQK